MKSESAPLRLFVSYSQQDTEHFKRLKIHLTPYLRGARIEDWLWDRSQVVPGTRWHDQLGQMFQRIDAAILLISADFLAADFIQENELPPLLVAAEQQGKHIIPVLLSPCGFEQYPELTCFHAAHPLNQPLSSMRSWQEREHWWSDVAQAIHRLITMQKAQEVSPELLSPLESSQKMPHPHRPVDKMSPTNTREAAEQPSPQRPITHTTLHHSQGTVIGQNNTVQMHWHIASAPPSVSSDGNDPQIAQSRNVSEEHDTQKGSDPDTSMGN